MVIDLVRSVGSANVCFRINERTCVAPFARAKIQTRMSQTDTDSYEPDECLTELRICKISFSSKDKGELYSSFYSWSRLAGRHFDCHL